MPSLVHVEPRSNYRVKLAYDDGISDLIDLFHLVGQGVFSAWSDATIFDQVRIGEFGELTWGNGLDLCPDALYLQISANLHQIELQQAWNLSGCYAATGSH